MVGDYRGRVYNAYVTSRQRVLAPTTIEELKPRAPYLNRLIQEHFSKDKDVAILDIGCGHGAVQSLRLS